LLIVAVPMVCDFHLLSWSNVPEARYPHSPAQALVGSAVQGDEDNIYAYIYGKMWMCPYCIWCVWRYAEMFFHNAFIFVPQK